MTTKTALVTGGSDGVGLSIVRALAKNDFTVFFIGSNEEKGKKVEAQVREQGNSNVHFVRVDLSDLKQVKSFTQQFCQEQERLDLLANIAGVVLPQRQATRAGMEKTFTIGYLSAFLLCQELAPLLEKGEHPRIVNVSGGQYFALKQRVDFDDLGFSKKYNGFTAAAKTVHAKTVLAAILAGKLAVKGIEVNSFHPGIVKSSLARNFVWPMNKLGALASHLMPKDSKTGIYASLSDEMNGLSGYYLVGNKKVKLAFPEDYQERLWNESEKLLDEILTD